MENLQKEIYQLEGGNTEINVQLEKDTVWLSLNYMADLFRRDKSVISRYINDGKLYQVDYYNLDVIISVGY